MTTASKWYAIRVKAEAKAAEILIFGDIGESWWGESVTAKDFVKELNALDVDAITVRINSIGGSVPDGLAIYNAIKRHKAQITTSNEGMALSIASLILMAGDTVEMADNAMLMIHAPWAYAGGNAAELRNAADVLDMWADAMSTSYAAKTGKDKADMLALLTDGDDHWYTAEQARADGFIDAVVEAMPVAASFDLSRYRNLPAAAAAFNHHPQGKTMDKDDKKPAATAQQPPSNQAPQPAEHSVVVNAALAADQSRRNAIAANAAKFMTHEGMAELVASLQNDHTISEDAANKRILAHLAKGAEPVAGQHATVTEDAKDKFGAGVANALLARCGAKNAEGKPIRAEAGNDFRGMRLEQIAQACLAQAGINVKGMDRVGVVKKALAMHTYASGMGQTTSDFPVLLENVMHRQVLTAFQITPDTYTRWCKIGSVSDFREWQRLRGGTIGNIDPVNEHGEYKSLVIPDMAKEGISAKRRGGIVSITPEIVINDDIGYISDTTAMLGRAAKRTIETSAYAALTGNPALKDGVALFHADHGNLAVAGAALSVDSLDAARVAMASQKDLSGNEYLDIRPEILLAPLGMGGTARVIVDAVYDPDTANKLQRPNKVNGIVQDVVDTPRLTGTAWYLFADPSVAPVVEVVFLDGESEPMLAMEENFDTAGIRYRVELPFGVGVIGYEGAYKNPGA
ncbi:ClpP-like prohead protease/major capsid protein fusion protein [Methylomonas sp. HYX-M1]|uniref:ClpP-like prohead protease/major capsid protein fusion protein n=1 Tax=Methylomonas sp. HYX-M1 TaxID=3139307 RepID=UPI00345BC82A